MNEINFIFDKLFSYFNVVTITELAKKLGISQPTVTNWQRRNSINAIKKRCRELGIYNEIFDNFNSNMNYQNISDNHGNLTQNGMIHNNLNKNLDNLSNIDEAVLSMFKRAYNKCLNDDKGKSINQDKLDELIIYLTKFK